MDTDEFIHWALAQAGLVDDPEIFWQARRGFEDAQREHGERWASLSPYYLDQPYVVGYLAAVDLAEYNGDWES